MLQPVRELQRDGFWERMFPDWETCCQALFQRPAVWVQQVVEGVRVLHAQGHQGEISKEQALAALNHHGGDRRSEQARQDQGAVRTLKRGSESAVYIRARLQRDHPEIAEALNRGEFRSARAAAIEAGIIKPVATVRLVDDMAAVAASLHRRLSPEQVEQLKALL